MPQTNVKTYLVDRRNADTMLPFLIDKASKCTMIGFDTETDNRTAHEGIKKFNSGTRSAFDWRRMFVTGMSFSFLGDGPIAYYLNMAHADSENCLTWEEVKPIFDAVPSDGVILSHNAPFELTVMANNYGIELRNVICTLQMAVSAYGPDEYDHEKYIGERFGDIKNLFQDINLAFSSPMDLDENGNIKRGLNWQQLEVLNKVLGKQSVATFSYNGFIQSIRYGYGLKEAVQSFFGHKMTTYEEVIKGREGMADLTGDEVVQYGGEDAYFVIPLFYKLMDHMAQKCPETIDTFFEQENPMIYIFSDIRREGIRVNLEAVESRRAQERSLFAQGLRDFKAVAKKLLPFPEELNQRLAEYDTWYGPNPKKDGQIKGYEYRQRVVDWLNSPDKEDDFEQACQVSSSVSSAWAGHDIKALNLGHYFQSRLFMYDLCRTKPIIYKGKVQSDAEARGTLKERFKNLSIDEPENAEWHKLCVALIDRLSFLTNIETRMKLYLNPYTLLTDPETLRMYPEISSMLATRRMAGSNPNPMQLAKRGESTYVRGFYLPDQDDHVYIAPDWSQIELVLIGEFSGDPEFKEAFGQLPYKDLHLGAAADVLSVVIEGVTADLLKNMHKMDEKDIPEKLLIKPNGEKMSPVEGKKYWRTEVGKGSNFNYWYSGALSTVGEVLGWTPDQMWEATEAYRTRFAVAEAWRVGLIEQAKFDGYVLLPDGHRRTRWEVTHEWASITRNLFSTFGLEGVNKFAEEFIKKTRTRAGNQLVNAKIQGTCATLAKRSALTIKEEIKGCGFDAFFKMPVHDELVYSVNRRHAVEFIKMIRGVMSNHPSIISNLKIDCSVAMGRSFEPYKKDKLPHCLVELDEAPDILGFEEGSKLSYDQIEQTLEFMFRGER